MYKLAQRFYDPDDAGGEGGGTNTPLPATPPAVPAAASDVAAHVDDAALAASAAAAQTGEVGWKEIASELKGLRGDIKELSGKLPAAPAAPETPAPAPAPIVKPPVAPIVTPPKPPEKRKIRRNGRIVYRD